MKLGKFLVVGSLVGVFGHHAFNHHETQPAQPEMHHDIFPGRIIGVSVGQCTTNTAATIYKLPPL